MPFKSKSRQRFMFAKHPKTAKEWAAKYGLDRNMLETVNDRVKKARKKKK